MNSFELNKIFGAILGTLVFVMGVGFIADEVYAPIEGRGANYALPEPAEEGEGGGEEAPGVEPIAARMQTASAEAGEASLAAGGGASPPSCAAAAVAYSATPSASALA